MKLHAARSHPAAGKVVAILLTLVLTLVLTLLGACNSSEPTAAATVTLKALDGTEHTFQCEAKIKLAGEELKFLVPYYDEVAAVNPELVKAKEAGGFRKVALIILREKCGL